MILPDRRGMTEESRMERQGDEVHVTETEASGGSRPGIVRYVLGISLLLVAALMSLVWIIGSTTR